MRIKVKVIARASKCEIVPLDEQQLKVKVTQPALEGRANHQVIELLAEYFQIPKKSITLISGVKNCHKTFEIKASIPKPS